MCITRRIPPLLLGPLPTKQTNTDEWHKHVSEKVKSIFSKLWVKRDDGILAHNNEFGAGRRMLKHAGNFIYKQ
jgi:hypothetical protein